jgi:type IV pilus assembly protein PilB
MVGHDNQLGMILVEEGSLSRDDLELALREHHKTGERLGDLLLKMGFVDEEGILRALARQLAIPFVKISDIEIPDEVIALVPARVAHHYHLVPVDRGNGSLRVAMSDPLDVHTLDDLQMMLKMGVEPVVATNKEIDEALRRFYGIGAETVEGLIDDAAAEGKTLEVEAQVEDIDAMAEDASIVRFVNQIIQEAMRDRSTDIHIEPLEKELRIRYRIDGLLYEAAIPASIRKFQSAIISRVKIMADLNIAERRLPQDGKIKIKRGDQDFDLRVSTVPTPYGESISIRILSRDADLINLERLGLSERNLEHLRHILEKPHGIMLVTGPTGSGKSTTLYAALSEINKVDRKIITIEDPIEYRINGVTQIQVNPQIDLTFGRCLRTILRQDPDILMVGEIRDTETAQITIRTALTGHLVFSTLHTNDATGAVTRLLDMGIEPFLVSSSVLGIIAQRLVRVLCPECKRPFDPPESVIRRVNTPKDPLDGMKFYRGQGCESCRYTGFRGRTAIFEFVRITEEFRRLVVERVGANILKQQALRDGMTTLRHDGWRKVKAGLTTLDEVLRVTLEDEFEVDDEVV